ncbi:hypothetical protein GCM10009827_058570 [Dactylosporangium maewongense]|uniref:Uncharacterized protein n=2 Tax=Micromonosporaceae TaxID=28056 RepID=A0ABP4LWA1_9ACTN
MFRIILVGNIWCMQPGASAGDEIVVDTQPFLRVGVGMPVVDEAGEQIGVVAAVQGPGTDIRPDTIAGIAEHLMGTGYARIDGTGFLSNDVYAAGNQISGVTDDVVELHVGREELHRATS